MFMFIKQVLSIDAYITRAESHFTLMSADMVESIESNSFLVNSRRNNYMIIDERSVMKVAEEFSTIEMSSVQINLHYYSR